MNNIDVTLYVVACSEFHELGPVYDGLHSASEAVENYNDMLQQYGAYVPAIGIKLHTPGTDEFEDTEWDIVVGKCIDLDMLNYVDEILKNEEALQLISDLTTVISDVEVRGECVAFDNIKNVQTEPSQEPVFNRVRHRR